MVPMQLLLVIQGLGLLLSVVDGDKQSEAIIIPPPLYQLESYLKSEVLKGLEKLEQGRFLIPEVVNNIKNTLIAASVQKQSLFRIVLKEYFKDRPAIYLITGIVDALYESKQIEKALAKVVGNEVDPELFHTYIEDTALDLEDIVDRFIQPIHPKDNMQ